MPLYEVELLADGFREVRLSDRRLTVGETVAIGSRHWVVEKEVATDAAESRFRCREPQADRAANGRARRLKRTSKRLDGVAEGPRAGS